MEATFAKFLVLAFLKKLCFPEMAEQHGERILSASYVVGGGGTVLY